MMSQIHLSPLVNVQTRSQWLHRLVVTTEQMGRIEERVFEAGMPVAALMEKVAGLLTQRIQALYPRSQAPRVGVLVGPGHNGGDALVVARELHFSGYQVKIHQPLNKTKTLTESHAQYAASLSIPFVDKINALEDCDLLIDGLFGFGLTRPLEGEMAAMVDRLNQWSIPVVSIDLPSGIHTDTGAVLGTAVCATHTLCLGLWKKAFLQEQALTYLGRSELIDFGLPLADMTAILGETPILQRITPELAIQTLPLSRPLSTHKYKQGHLLLICGSRPYMGAALLAGLSARSSGVGMLSIAVPESLRLLLIGQLPDALVISCPEDEKGGIAQLPGDMDLSKYTVIGAGCGLTQGATAVIEQILASDRPLLLDADGLNILAQLDTIPTLQNRSAPTVLTPHQGEFKRLFPDLAEIDDRIIMTQQAAKHSGAIVLLKGARTIIASPEGKTWLNPESTPALARGGSGDVLTGLMSGLLAQGMMGDTDPEITPAAIVFSAVWWHSQAAILAAKERSEIGVDASTLIDYLIPGLPKDTH
jgi:ADP-dependent NAD(P)H-hydrate dehydratase / NAD(P)H-hydrate epimerase